jgi:ABC-type branched-subunit amino acid transport system permease subunit
MIDYLFYLLLGTGAGAIIAALGLGLVVTYQGCGVVNFALGAMATWTAYVYADLRDGAYPFPFPGLPGRYHFDDDVGLVPALTLALVTGVGLSLAIYLLVFRPLRRAPALANVVASVGLTIVITALVERRFEDNTTIRVDPILPREPVTIADGLTIPRDGLWLLAIVILIAVALWLGSRFTAVGLATRAAAQNEKGAVLLGYSPDRLALLSFVTAGLVTGFVAILAAPMIQLGSAVLTFGFLIPALGAALIGTYTNLLPTLVAGVTIGMVQSSFTKLQGDLSWFPDYGAREGLPFLVIIIAMVLLGERLPERGSINQWRLPTVPPARVTTASVVVPVAAAIGGLLLFGTLWRAAIMTTAIAVVMSLSFVVLTGFAGQSSLAQMAFAGIAGFALSRLAMRFEIPFPVAPILAILVATAFGVLLGLPALRLRGTNLAIVTLAGGVAVNEFVFKNPAIVGDIQSGGAKVPNPDLWGWDFGLVLGDKYSRPIFGVFLVVVALIVALGVANLRRSATGRRMLAVRSNERAAAAAGISVAGVKLQAFALSAAVAGTAGCLLAYRFGAVSEMTYGLIASLTALAVAYLGGITSVSGGVTAGILATSGVAFFGMTQIIGSLGPWGAFIGGVLLIVTAVQNPEGIAGVFRARAAAARRQRAAASTTVSTPVLTDPLRP